MKPGFYMIAALLIAGCASQPARSRMVLPEGDRPAVQWSEEEKAASYVLRTLKRTDHASFHIVRVRTAEEPHVHDRHDGTVVVLQGRCRIHFENRSVDLRPGDVVEIMRGQFHWAENQGPEAAEAYVVFTPPFDGKDRRLVPGPS